MLATLLFLYMALKGAATGGLFRHVPIALLLAFVLRQPDGLF